MKIEWKKTSTTRTIKKNTNKNIDILWKRIGEKNTLCDRYINK